MAGSIAIATNTALLVAADWIPLVTARGGLLKLLTSAFGSTLSRLGVQRAWASTGLPLPPSTAFQLGFHVVVGLTMAVFYGVAVEPLVRGKPWWKGVLCAAGAWAANALIVLPWLGEGIAGSRRLSIAGMAYFAAAHTVFFVLLAVLFARFNRSRT